MGPSIKNFPTTHVADATKKPSIILKLIFEFVLSLYFQIEIEINQFILILKFINLNLKDIGIEEAVLIKANRHFKKLKKNIILD